MIVVIVLPYLLAVAAPVLPAGATDWLLRVTPAAAFAVQQTARRSTPRSATLHAVRRVLPAVPWAGFAVLAAWAAVALGLAAYLLRRRDA